MCSISAHSGSRVLSALANIAQSGRRVPIRYDRLVMMAAAVGTCSTAFASDRPLEPLQNPGECPIDAPLRVANVDTLMQYEGLLGHCEATAIIESPAYHANRPSKHAPARTIVPDPGKIGPETGGSPMNGTPRGSRAAMASATTSETPGNVAAPTGHDLSNPANKENRVRTIVAPDRSNVTIIPMPSRLVARHATEPANRASSSEVSAVLALRPQSYTTIFDEEIAEAAQAHAVDPLLLHAVIKQESNYRHKAVSRAGARGLMQVMPGTGRMLGVTNADDLFVSRINIDAGARLLCRLWRTYDGNIDLVLAAYNAGEGAVRRYHMKVPPFRETREYVAKVKANYTLLARESGLAVNF